jgi:pimeloyl-ACP methyl ester carboxylesterase
MKLSMELSMKFSKQWIGVLVVSSLISSCSNTNLAKPAQPALPRFEADTCPFTQGVNLVRCGFVVVPTRHTEVNSSKTLKLAVAVIKGKDSSLEPTFFLNGGPGVQSQFLAANYPGATLNPYGTRGDIVVLDQRGVGLSQPALECKGLDILSGSDVEQNRTVALNCIKDFKNQGIDLSSFNTLENAADINDIRIALGYTQINVYGASYGSLLAQQVMKDFPKAVRSAVLDGVLSPESKWQLEDTRSFDTALKTLFAACKTDNECNGKIPNPQATFEKALKEVEDHPISLCLTTDCKSELPITPLRALESLRWSMYNRDQTPYILDTLFNIANGKSFLISGAVSQTIHNTDGFSMGMFALFACADNLSSSSSADFTQALEGVLPVLQTKGAGRERFASICKEMGIEPAPVRLKEPLSSNIPVLLFAGAFDPITPPSYAEKVVAKLTRAQLIRVPAGGHGFASPYTPNTCGHSILKQFLEKPELPVDSSCAATPFKFQTLTFGKN